MADKRHGPGKADHVIPSHESPVRRVNADTGGTPYIALKSLVEAQSYSDGVVVFEGDWGGQIYLVTPAALVACSHEVLRRLVADMHKLISSDSEGAAIYFERHAQGEVIAGGMGGGIVTPDVWVHRDFVKLRIRSNILAVLRGERDTLR